MKFTYRILFVVIILTLIFFETFAWESQWLKIDGELSGNYDFASTEIDLRGIDLDFAFFIGLGTLSLTHGFELSGDWQSLTINSDAAGLSAFELGGYYKAYYRLFPWFEWQWGGGLLWQYENYLEGTVDFSTYLLGPSFFNTLNFDLLSPDWGMELSGKVDLLFSYRGNESLTFISPCFTGGLRFIYSPVPDKLDIFLDINALFRSFQNDSFMVDPWAFQAGGGVAYNAPLFEILKVIRRNETFPGERFNLSTSIDLINAPFEIIALIKGRFGDIVTFHNIRFKKNSEISDETPGVGGSIEEEGLAVLKEIGEVLIKRKDLGVSISAYAESEGDPEKEFELALRRAEVIRDYFISLGFDPQRIRSGTSGRLASTEETMVITFQLFNYTTAPLEGEGNSSPK